VSRVPFDSLCLAAVADECQRLVGGRVQRVAQWDAFTIGLGIYRQREEWLLLSCDPRYFRAHLIARRPDSPPAPPSFCMALRKHLGEARVEFVRQRGLDRVLDVGLSSESGDLQLVAELMGKHSNLVLVDAARKVLAAAKVVGSGKSKRPVVPGREYAPPPFPPRPSLLEARQGDGLAQYEGWSPFLQRLLDSGVALGSVQAAIEGRSWSPSYAEGHGGYPLSLTKLFANAVPRESVSNAIEQGYERAVSLDRFQAAQSALLAQLRRVMDARNRALDDIAQALDTAARAREMQERAELILAYQGQIRPGDRELEAVGYDGRPVVIALNPERTAVENAQRLFDKARRAKEGASELRGQQDRLVRDRQALAGTLAAAERATTFEEVAALREEADRNRWLHHAVVAKAKEDRPYEGFSVKELVSPGGWRVLYGENATSNDYVTTKLARPNDYWFHVRGVTSAHVVLQTQNQPQRVQKEDLLFAGRVAVAKSASKHSSYVAVDYTLRKYVRKPRKAAPGFVAYSQEKTLHIEQ
jgi:predicted ribosome quality control (RQC) complex YloA/Tae2 family protein